MLNDGVINPRIKIKGGDGNMIGIQGFKEHDRNQKVLLRKIFPIEFAVDSWWEMSVEQSDAIQCDLMQSIFVHAWFIVANRCRNWDSIHADRPDRCTQ